MKLIGIVLAYVVGAYFVVRAIVELVTIDYGDAASYETDWGGPSLAGVLAVHCLPGVISLVLMIWGARRLRQTTVDERRQRLIAAPIHNADPGRASRDRRRVEGRRAASE